jgi:hypothetical protein
VDEFNQEIIENFIGQLMDKGNKVTAIDHPSESRQCHLLSAALYCPLPLYVKIGAKWKHFLIFFS